MKVAYFDCFSGISGDMTLAALLDAGMPLSRLRAELKKLNLGGYTLSSTRTSKCGIAARKVDIKIAKSAAHGHRSYSDIVKLIQRSRLADTVKRKALDIFDVIARAESRIHDTHVDKLHFHEVGAVDSIVDICGAAIGLDYFRIDSVCSSAVNTGSGSVVTAHGTLPVPAPATSLILLGAPTYADGPAVELTTPTGAAILKATASKFGPQPPMKVNKVGHGAGDKNFADRPDILRIFIGETDDSLKEERLIELQTSVDDMNPQTYSVVSDQLFAAGALDVVIAPVIMKKGRPGNVLTVLCSPRKSVELERILFIHTPTLGIRRREVDRVSLPREIVKVKTAYGTIAVKVGHIPGGGTKQAPEFESVKKAAYRHGVPHETVYRAALAGARPKMR